MESILTGDDSQGKRQAWQSSKKFGISITGTGIQKKSIVLFRPTLLHFVAFLAKAKIVSGNDS